MTRGQKLVARLKSQPKDFKWEELIRLLSALGYEEIKSGRTSGSRHRFTHDSGSIISLHRPHPGNVVKVYVIRNVLKVLQDEKLI